MRHQHLRQWGANHRPAAETHDRHAGGHTTPVRKPFYQGRYGGDITKSQANAAKDAGTEPENPQLMGNNAASAEEKASRPAEGGDHARLARTGSFQPSAPDGGRDAQH